MSLSSLRSLPRATAPVWRDEIVGLPGLPDATVRIYGACGEDCGRSPLVIHFHAGEFVRGSLADGARVANLIAASGAVVASVEYPLAPEHPFPSAAETGHAVLAWAERQRRRLGATNTRVFVAGEEAGGNIAYAVSMMARDRGGPALAGAILLSPMLDVCIGSASQRHAKVGAAGCPWAQGWRAYLARADDAIHPYAAPAAATRLAGLPRTLLVTSVDDPQRDETQAFAKRLRAAGVPADAEVLATPTGWPRSYLDPDADAPWAAALRTRLQPFLHSDTLPTGSAS